MNASTRAVISETLAIVQRMWYDAYGELFSKVGGNPGGAASPLLFGTTIIDDRVLDVLTLIEGEAVADAADALTDLLYRGESYDANANLQYLRARHYDQNSGVFTSFDPYAGDVNSPLTLMRWAYASGNAIYSVDPSGESSLSDLGISVLSRISLFASQYGKQITTTANVLIGTFIVSTIVAALEDNGIVPQTGWARYVSFGSGVLLSGVLWLQGMRLPLSQLPGRSNVTVYNAKQANGQMPSGVTSLEGNARYASTPPYREGSVAIGGVLDQNVKYVRLFATGRSGRIGQWIVRRCWIDS
jgi:RHS repeat-associated protein